MILTNLFDTAVCPNGHLSLKKPRNVVEDCREYNRDEQLLSTVDTAHACIEWSTDGHVSVNGHKENRPDRHCLTD